VAGSSKILTAYLGLTRCLDPVYRRVVSRRLAQGKEHQTRYMERFGEATFQRPHGALIWFHAASVGETQSLLGLIPALLRDREDLTILLTSGTVTSAKLLERDLPDRAIHQFAPVDTPRAMRRFLDHWKPDLAIWVESEIWPRMLVETKKREIPMLLLNARVSSKTLERWTFARRAAKALFDMFDHVLVQDSATNSLLAGLGIPDEQRTVTGSLKSELAPPIPDTSDAEAILKRVRQKLVWVAASTHPGEDEIVLRAHATLPEDWLLILVPRHPDRGEAIEKLSQDAGFETVRRSLGRALDDATGVYIADTLGEMGLWYRAAPVSFIGGSLMPIGGHNPYEPILLGSNVITGPHIGNFQDIYSALDNADGCLIVANAEELSDAVKTALTGQAGDQMHANAKGCLLGAHSVTDQVKQTVLLWLSRSE
jgi:3-deoxy-D-manno-octulosonic-acid transferase